MTDKQTTDHLLSDDQVRQCITDIGRGGAAGRQAAKRLFYSYAAPLLARRLRKSARIITKKPSDQTTETLIIRRHLAPEDIDEIIQDTFLKLIKSVADNGDYPENLGAWLSTACDSCEIDFYRRNQRQVDTVPLLPDDPEAPAIADPDNSLTELALDCARHAFAAFQQQHPEIGAMAIRHVWDGKPWEEIAAELGSKAGAVRQRWSDWKDRLWAFVTEFCPEHFEQ